MRLLCMGVPSKMVRLGLTQIDLIIQILLFPLRVPRFLRETPLPLADAADGAERGIVKRDAMSCEACDTRRTTARAVAISITLH